MEHYTYLIIGGGMAADAAVRGIRECDLSGRIGIIGEEPYKPYKRPPLTKGLWTGTQEEEIWLKTDLETVSFHLGKRVVSIDRKNHVVQDHMQESYSYDKLLLATGGLPRRLNCPDEGVIYFRSLSDYRNLRAHYTKGEDFVIIGGGFIGSEIAASLAMNGKNVTLIVREQGIHATLFPSPFSQFLTTYYIEKGVNVLCEEEVISVTKVHGTFFVETNRGHTIQADGVVAGLGIQPATELAHSSGLHIDNGIAVNSILQTNDPDIFSAGDAANFYSPHLEKRVRIEHEDNALKMGKSAGRNLTGAQEQYLYLPFFYSDLFEFSYEAIGEIQHDMEIIEEWEDPYRKGILYYKREGALRGAVLWGVWNQLDQIRALIGAKSVKI